MSPISAVLTTMPMLPLPPVADRLRHGRRERRRERAALAARVQGHDHPHSPGCASKAQPSRNLPVRLQHFWGRVENARLSDSSTCAGADTLPHPAVTPARLFTTLFVVSTSMTAVSTLSPDERPQLTSLTSDRCTCAQPSSTSHTTRTASPPSSSPTSASVTLVRPRTQLTAIGASGSRRSA